MQNLKKLLIGVKSFLLTFPFAVYNVYAVKPGSHLRSNEGFMEIYTGILGISSGLAVVGITICIIRYMMAEDTSDAGAAKKDGKQVLLAWIIINLFGAIMSSLYTLVSDISL